MKRSSWKVDHISIDGWFAHRYNRDQSNWTRASRYRKGSVYPYDSESGKSWIGHRKGSHELQITDDGIIMSHWTLQMEPNYVSSSTRHCFPICSKKMRLLFRSWDHRTIITVKFEHPLDWYPTQPYNMSSFVPQCPDLRKRSRMRQLQQFNSRAVSANPGDEATISIRSYDICIFALYIHKNRKYFYCMLRMNEAKSNLFWSRLRQSLHPFFSYIFDLQSFWPG